MRAKLMLVWLMLALAAINWQMVQKEHILSHGHLLLLKLAPVDPRSLMQGDYMALNYEISRQASETLRTRAHAASDGRLVLALDQQGVARFSRLYTLGEALGKGEYLLRYRYRQGAARLGAESFFFQEGQGEVFAQAEYGGLRAAPDGESVLIGLYDKDQRLLSPPP